MRLGAFTVLEEYADGGASSGDRVGDALEIAQAGEEAGLDSFWVAEHHFHGAGVCPAPSVVLAAAGARTKRLRLGSLVSVLPFHRPVDVAEQYATLDRLTDGRLNFGVGSGYIPEEFEGFGIDPAHKREMFDRALETILLAFRGAEFRAEPGGPLVRLNVLPKQQPHPPLTIAAQRREALPFVARRGASVALIPYATVGSLAELADVVREYRAHLPPGSTARVLAAAHVYAGPDRARAERALQRYLDGRLSTQSTFYQEKVRKDAHLAKASAIVDSGLALLGTPGEVREKAEGFRRAGVDVLLGIFDFGGLPVAEASRSIRALGPFFER